jgi:nicotinamidase/pyrazinamidase
MQRYDDKTALLVIDVQNDFADPNGSLSVAGGDALIPRINGEISMATSAGATVVATQDWHPESTPHFAKDGGIWPVHCVGGTWGAELHPDLQMPEDAPRVRKGTGGEDGYSGFTMRDPVTGEEASTGLDALLKERGIGRVVIIGLATDYCVQASVLDAARLGYETAVLTDLCAPVNLQPGDGARAEQTMREAGVQMWQTRMR